MNYIPGCARIKMKKAHKSKYRDIFVVKITCDANDGDYMNDTFTVEAFNELEILMLAYLQLSTFDIPKNWTDTVKANKENNNFPFGGTYLEDNLRFNRTGERHSWIENWASENSYLIYASMCDSMCHSIEIIDVIYYDADGNPNKCEFPKLGKLFDSEKEFITYIRDLDIQLSKEDDED